MLLCDLVRLLPLRLRFCLSPFPFRLGLSRMSHRLRFVSLLSPALKKTRSLPFVAFAVRLAGALGPGRGWA